MRLASLVPALLLLAACGDRAPDDASRAATGEVLEGTISDAMLPLDRVRSQPPLAEPEARAAVAGQAQPDPAAAPDDDDEPQEAAADADED